jgi:pyridoxal phosphate-dependent aminotransferase EpsN
MASEKKRIYLSLPHMSGEEQKYVEDAFATNWIAPLGPNVDAFEKELADCLGVSGVTVLSSGTAALHLALLLFGVGRGDSVFCSTLTFAATSNPILYLGAEPVFIDSEPESWNMSPQALKRALSEAESEGRLPKAVIVVNLYGQSADLDPLIELCDHYGIPLIEDAAESLGATYKGKMSGSLGRIGILSFNGNKIITTSGGGALVSNDFNLIKRARYLATQARQPARHYEHTETGFNYRMSNVLAGIGRGQLEVLEERVEARRAVFERYREALEGMAGFDFMPEAGFGRSTRWLTVLTVDPEICGVSRDDIIDALEVENIEARPVWKPMHLQPLYKGCRYYIHEPQGQGTVPSSSLADPRFAAVTLEPSPGPDLSSPRPSILKGEGDIRGSVSDRLFEQGLCLPSGSNLSIEDQDKVIDCITKMLRKR